jgi:STE24 endopeptidase
MGVLMEFTPCLDCLIVTQCRWDLMVTFDLLSCAFLVIFLARSFVVCLADALQIRQIRVREQGSARGHSEDLPSAGATLRAQTELLLARLEIVRKCARDLLILGLIVSPALISFDEFVRGLGLPFALASTVFFVGLWTLLFGIQAPVIAYERLVARKQAESRLTGQTPDLPAQLKGLLVQGLLLACLATAGAWAIRIFPDTWWILALMAGGAAQAYTRFLHPVVMEPMLTRQKPLEDEALLRRLRELVQKAGVASVGLYVIESESGQAALSVFCAGVGRMRRIVLSSSALVNMNHDEIAGLVAHELGHVKKRNHLWSFVAGASITFVFVGLAFLAIRSDAFSRSFAVGPDALFDRIFLASVFVWSVGFFMKPAYLALMRRFEREADEFASRLQEGSGDLALALGKIYSFREGCGDLHPFLQWLHSSHPPLSSRIRALQQSPKEQDPS